jgi:hypothetical protein
VGATLWGALIAAAGTLLGGLYAAWAAKSASSMQVEAEVFKRAREHYDDILQRQADEIAYLGRQMERIRTLLESEQNVSDQLRSQVRELTRHVAERPDPMAELREDPLAPHWPPRNGIG